MKEKKEPIINLLKNQAKIRLPETDAYLSSMSINESKKSQILWQK